MVFIYLLLFFALRFGMFYTKYLSALFLMHYKVSAYFIVKQILNTMLSFIVAVSLPFQNIMYICLVKVTVVNHNKTGQPLI